MKRLEEALKFIPLEEKLGLLEALRAAPHLVTRESDVTRFLVTAGGDSYKAAQRLCRYWNERRRAYGSVLAYQPLAVTASRPPDAHDDGRTCTVLPPDATGASVLYYDKTLPANRALLHPQPDPVRARVLFFACQRCCAESATAGVVLILRVDPTESAQALRFHKAHNELGHYLAHVFPVQVKAWHIVALLDDTSSQSQQQQLLWVHETLPVLVARWEAILGRAPAHIHVGANDATVCASLRQYGLPHLQQLPRPGMNSNNSTTTAGGLSLSKAAAAAIGNVAAAIGGNLAAADTSGSAGAATSSPGGPRTLPQPALVAAMPNHRATATAASSQQPQQLQQQQLSPSLRGVQIAPAPTTVVAATAATTTPTNHANNSKKNSSSSPTTLLPDWQKNTLQHAEAIPGVLDDPDMREQGLVQLTEAIRFLPEHQTAAYRQAQRQCPELIQLESDPLKFLRFHRYNAWDAAQRITLYWTKRKEVFQERAFLPMSMTGEGALDQQDITFLQTGFFCFLPRDRDGRTVICYDPSRRTQQAKKHRRLRIGFYVWHIICENETCIRNGYVGIVLLQNGQLGMSSLDAAIREKVDLVVDSFPTESKNFHVVQTIRPTKERRSLLQMALPYLLNVMGRILEKTGVTHAPESQIEMAQEFESYGVSVSGLPVSAGGTWTYDEFYQWQLERYRVERKRYDWSRYRSAEASTAVPSRALSADESVPAMSFSSLFLPQQQQQSFVELDYVVRRLSQNERMAYVEACMKAPHLVRNESKPAWFSAHAQGDLRLAARQLAAYWTLRKRLFADRAFLPMAQTGEGALGRKELTLLNSGFFTVLPTKQNEAVIVSYDCAKDDTTDEIGRLRVAFYTLSLAAERDISRSQGFCIVASGLKALAKLKEDGAVSTNIAFDALLDVIPIRVSAIHIAMLLQPGTVSYPLDNTVKVMRGLFGSIGTSKGMVHVGTSRDEIAEQLGPYNIEKSLLPRHLGGSFGYDRFTQWQELRIRYEWGLPAGANDTDALEIYDFSKVKSLSDMSEDEKKERKRRMNVVHSRRKRERERIEIEVLQEQCDELRDRRVVLTEDTHRLEGLLQHAHGLVNAAESPTGDRKPSPEPKGS